MPEADTTNVDSTADDDTIVSDTQTATLPLMPIPGGVVLPEMVITVALETDESQAAANAASDDLIALVPKLVNGYSTVGVIARIENRGTLRSGLPALTIRATDRALIGAGVLGTGATLWVEATPVHSPTTDKTQQLADRYREVANTLLDHLGAGSISAALPETEDPSALADTVAYWPDLTLEQRV